MTTLDPGQLQRISKIYQYQMYLNDLCVTSLCKGKPKLYYQDPESTIPDRLTAWSLCEKCKNFKEISFSTRFKEYSEKELFTIKLYYQ